MKYTFTKEAKIGLVAVLSLILLYTGVNYLKGINLFKPSNHYYVAFDNVKDVTVSSPVFIEGFKVGLVRTIEYDYTTTGSITVEIGLDEDMKINKGSYITIVKSLLSGAELHIHLNTYISEYMEPGSTMEGRMESDMLGTVQERILPDVAGMLPKLDSILTGLQALVNHPALAQSLEHIERTTANLETSTRELNRLLNNDVPTIVGNLKSVTDNFNEVSTNLKGLDLASTMQAVNATLSNLKETTDRLQSKDNSLGLLLNDKAFYDNLNKTSENAAALFFDLRENPKRYVHFSLF
ncbi:virulence factor Mce family protein [Bacteroidales bacterium Barb6]|nr:virulence factor Mce family protein [Bacteroidales bacterium Barb6XT]OAV71865.1 virulence factor Mce family protein [Bacteroidales bacterium Barb6]